MIQTNTAAFTTMNSYQIGDYDQRPWGDYVVTDIGINDSKEEFCEKIITINPGKILSLQSHDYRREIWTVKKGSLTALIDCCKFSLKEGETIIVPKGSIHCMANTTRTPCIVLERQEGICREDDIRRYLDANGRETRASKQKHVQANVDLYHVIVEDTKNLSV